ncbi:MAG: hypothetical protein FD124_2845 [Alphaproteobacteria bacterium]|nr:MAG: hypothetical protein FD160_2112 [Caulobacteraceae bacterium]TPW03895.1 MAG: hypothetical protein FD124_2845 [Alphaproteobacteria bacterium]
MHKLVLALIAATVTYFVQPAPARHDVAVASFTLARN